MNTERICYFILTFGVVSSTSLLSLGLALYFSNLPYERVMLSGIVFLLLTPLTTVSSTIFSFFRKGERVNMLVSVVVLASMLLAVLIGLLLR